MTCNCRPMHIIGCPAYGEDNRPVREPLTAEQETRLRDLCAGYKVPFNPKEFTSRFDLPEGYVAGWVGPIYVGCSPDGQISS